jgi:hypothetical protein
MRWCVPLALFTVSFNVYVMTVAVAPIARDLRTTLGGVHSIVVPFPQLYAIRVNRLFNQDETN